MPSKAQGTEKLVTEELVTPNMALDWLTANTNNRTISKKHVKLLAGMMERNEFHFVGDPIRFDVDGRLLDGQHRLHAIIDSETSQRFIIVRGLAPESQVYMDAGRKRSPGDQLAVALGIRNGNRAAAIVRNYLMWRDGLLISETRTISVPEIVTYAEDNEDLVVDATLRASRITSASVPTSAAVCGAVYLAARRINEHDAEVFWERMADGVDLDATNPILVLRNAIIRRARRERWKRTEEWAYYARSWNTWRKNGSLERLQGWRDSITLENLRLR
jgi:hypothetical protein